MNSVALFDDLTVLCRPAIGDIVAACTSSEQPGAQGPRCAVLGRPNDRDARGTPYAVASVRDATAARDTQTVMHGRAMRRAAFLVGAAAAAFAVGGSRRATAGEELPTADELRAALFLTVTPSPIDAPLGSPVTIAIILKNGSSTDFWFFHSAPALDYAIRIMGADGNVLPRRPPGLITLSNRNMRIAAHGEWTSVVRVDRLFALEMPGTFTLDVSTHFVFSMIPRRWPQRYAMTGTLAQGDVAYERRVDLTAKPVAMKIVP